MQCYSLIRIQISSLKAWLMGQYRLMIAQFYQTLHTFAHSCKIYVVSTGTTSVGSLLIYQKKIASFFLDIQLCLIVTYVDSCFSTYVKKKRIKICLDMVTNKCVTNKYILFIKTQDDVIRNTCTFPNYKSCLSSDYSPFFIVKLYVNVIKKSVL